MLGIVDFFSQIPAEFRFITIILIFYILAYTWFQVEKTERWRRLAVRIWPKSAEAHYNLGTQRSGQAEYSADAEQEIRQAIALQPHMWHAYFILVDILEKKGAEPSEIDALCQQMTQEFPNDPMVYLLRGDVLARRRELGNAEQAYRQAIQLAPQMGPAHENLGLALLNQERFLEAETEYRQAIEVGTTNANAHLQLAYVLQKLEKYVESEKEYLRVTKKEPDNITAYQWLASLYYEQRQYNNIDRVLHKGITKNPSDAYLHYLRGFYLFESRINTSDAESEIRQALSLFPNYADALQILGSILSVSSKYEEAEQAFRQSIAINPQNSRTFFLLGLTLGRNPQRIPEAESAYRKSIELDPAHSQAYCHLGDILAHQNQFIRAEDAYRKAIDLEPQEPFLYEKLALLLRRCKREKEALTLLEKAIELTPDDFDTCLELAGTYKSLNKPDKSKKNAKKASLLIPEDQDYWYNLACLESILGDIETAFDHLAKASREESFDVSWAWEDPDLQWLRDDPRFLEIVGPQPAS